MCQQIELHYKCNSRDCLTPDKPYKQSEITRYCGDYQDEEIDHEGESEWTPYKDPTPDDLTFTQRLDRCPACKGLPEPDGPELGGFELMPLSERCADTCRYLRLSARMTAASIEIGSRLVASGDDMDWTWPCTSSTCVYYAATLLGDERTMKVFEEGDRDAYLRATKSELRGLEELIQGKLEYPENPRKYVTADMFAYIYEDDEKQPTPEEHCAVYCLFLRLAPSLIKKAIDLVVSMHYGRGVEGHSERAIAAACIFKASNGGNEADRLCAEKIVDAVGVKDMKDLWSAYRYVQGDVSELSSRLGEAGLDDTPCP